MGVQETDPLSQLSLPPGFRFFPTDEELLVQYLCRKVAGHHFSLQIIAEIDLYKFDPWVLPSKAIFGEKEWYFFSPRDRKYPNGSRPNRVAGSGYWKATGTDKVILTQGRKVGIKKALVFYVGKAPKGTKTNWIMHEYRLSEPPRKTGTSRLDDWVLCRIYKKNSSGAARPQGGGLIPVEHSHGSSSSSSTQFNDVIEPLPDITDSDRYFPMQRLNVNANVNVSSSMKSNSINQQEVEDRKVNLLGSGSFDWATLAGLTTLPELGPLGGGGASQVPVVPMNNNGNNAAMQNDVYIPTLPRNDEEVQSGVRNNNRVQNHPGFFQQQFANQSFQDPVDPFGIRYPIQIGNMAVGFRQ